MSTKSRLLSATSSLALALAFIVPAGGLHASVASAAVPPAEASSNVQTELLLRYTELVAAEGMPTRETIERFLRSSLGEPTQDQAEAMPGLLSDLRGLGLSNDLFDVARQSLLEILAESPALHPSTVAAVSAELRDATAIGAPAIQLAQLAVIDPLGGDGICDPEVPDDPDCPPTATGAVDEDSESGGNQGGVYTG